MNDKKNNPLISVVLPVDRQETESLIDGCLSSLKVQTFQNFEVIIVTNRPENAFETLKNKYPSVKVLFSAENKSAARNLGSRRAAADFFLHLDVDMFLAKEVMAELAGKIKEGAQVVILPERFNPSLSYWAKVRDLEKKIYLEDKTIEAPRLIKNELFAQIKGFDEKLDPLDEWNLFLKIKKNNIKIDRINSCAWINRRVTLSQVIKRKYARGRLTRAFRKKYPEMHFLNPLVRLKSYSKNISLLAKYPAVALGLLFLKTVDCLAYVIGALNPPVSPDEQKKLFDQSAEKYENKYYLQNRGGRLIDEKEKSLVLNWLYEYLPTSSPYILDEGAGPGRWSQFILDNFENARVTAMDFSPKMLETARGKLAGSRRFRSVLSPLEKIDFPGENFDTVLNVRTLKYSPNTPLTLAEIERVLKPGGLFILEMPYKNPIASLLKIISVVWPTKSGLLGYFKRINLFSSNKIRRMLEENQFQIIKEESLGKLPATLYAKTDSSFLLKSYVFWEKILPKKLCGRSLFFLARKPEPRPEKEDILVSIIIPTKNSQKTLGALLLSIKEQDYKDWEIIVVDNNSSDGTAEIARQYTAEVFNFGPERSSQRNFGAKKSGGDWLLFLDSDMKIEKDLLSSCVRKTNGNPQIVALMIPEISEGKGFWAASLALERSCYPGDSLIEAARFINKNVFTDIGGYDEKLVAAEDWDLQQRLAHMGLTERVKANIIHDEGHLSIMTLLRKKNYYAKHFYLYRKKHPGVALAQMNLIFRKAYFRHWKKLAKDPLHATGFILLKILESLIGLSAYLKTKFK